jgi:integrase
MTINKIKPLIFKNLKATDKEQLIPDGGNLYVRIRSITDGGSISFRYFYRIDHSQKWMTLESTTLATARAERDDYKALIKKGIDPKVERTLQKERLRIQQIEEQNALNRLELRITVNDLFTRWFEMDVINRKDKIEIDRMFKKDVLPILGEIFVEEVRKGHVVQVIDLLKKRGVANLARNILKLMRQMFKFAVNRDLIEFDPTASLSIAKMTTTPTERDRILDESEIISLAHQLPSANLLKSTECALWIALSTMCRIGELSKTKITDIDFDLNTWIIPKENSKNGKAHTIYLSDFALNQFKILLQYTKSDTWIFTNRDGTDHVCEKSITKQLGGRQSQSILSNRSKDNQALVLKGGKWTPHDLRRTGATLMGDLGIAPDVIEKCLNHTEENKVKRIYQRQKLETEQAEAWQILGNHLDSLLTS